MRNAHSGDRRERSDSHSSTDELFASLDGVAALAVDRALVCLEALDERDTPADHDRGARSVESLMRVASTAAALRARLQKEATSDDEEESGAGRDGDIERAARDLAEKFEREFDRLERDLSAAPAGVSDGGCP